MKTRRSFAVTALTVAGLLSLYLCFLGLMGLAWSGFGRGNKDLEILGCFLPFLLALPLFVFSLGITRFATLGLWMLIPYHWYWLVSHLTAEGVTGPFDLLRRIALALITPIEIAFILLAVLVQFGMRVFKQFRFDQCLYRRMRGTSESGA